MGKLTGTVAAVALLAAIGVGSTLVTKAAINEQTATAANSFPTTAADFIREPDGVERKLMGSGKADRLASIADCGKQEWPFLTPDCFAAAPKPPQPAKPTVAVERRSEPNTSELVRTPASAAPVTARTTPAAPAPTTVVAVPAAPVAPAMAVPSAAVAAPAMVAAPACKQNLAAATARVERARAYLKSKPANGGADACAGYRRDFFEIVQAREVTAMCKTGVERERDLGTIDVAVESINGAIAQRCGS